MFHGGIDTNENESIDSLIIVCVKLECTEIIRPRLRSPPNSVMPNLKVVCRYKNGNHYSLKTYPDTVYCKYGSWTNGAFIK